MPICLRMAVPSRPAHHPNIGGIVCLGGEDDDDAVYGVLHGEEGGAGVCADIEHLEGRAFLFDAVAQGQHRFQRGEKRSGLLLYWFRLFIHLVKPFLLAVLPHKHLFCLTGTSRNGRLIWPGGHTTVNGLGRACFLLGGDGHVLLTHYNDTNLGKSLSFGLTIHGTLAPTSIALAIAAVAVSGESHPSHCFNFRDIHHQYAPLRRSLIVSR